MPDSTSRDYGSLLSAYPTALLTTLGPDGHFHSRPMAMHQTVRGEEIWFATAATAKKCKDLAAEPRCALTFFDAVGGGTISLSGVGEVIRDKKLLQELWNPSWARWFPRGQAQRDVALIRVIPEHVERIDGKTGKSELLFTSKPRRARRGVTRRRQSSSALG
jgi:general stress protein 26